MFYLLFQYAKIITYLHGLETHIFYALEIRISNTAKVAHARVKLLL